MRLSCCAYSYRQYLQSGDMSLDEFVQTAHAIGCDGVELTAYYFPSTTPDYLRPLKARIEGAGLAVSGTAIGTDFAQTAASKRAANVAMTKEWIEHSVTLGAPTLRVFAGPVREGSTEEEAFGWVVECLRECAPLAASAGVILALENHGGLTSTADQTLRLLDAVNSDAVRLNLDFGNFTGDIYAQFAQCAPHAAATHAKSHYHTPEGRAEVDYTRVRQILETAGYNGFVAIEYEEAEEPRQAVPGFVKALRTAFKNG